MSDMIEKVANALTKEAARQQMSSDRRLWDPETFARAAIEALRDMSLEMNDAFRGEVMNKEYLGDADVHMGWNAALDAALGEQEE